MRIFAEIDVGELFAERLSLAKSEVQGLDKRSFSQVDDESFALRLLSLVRIDPLHLKFDDACISTHERMIPAEQHPSHKFFLEPGESYRRQIIRYHLPFEGEPQLLRCIPNPRLVWSIAVEIGHGEVSFDIVNWGSDPEEVKREAEQIFGDLRKQLGNLLKQVDAFNASAQGEIIQLLSDWRAKVKKDSDFVAALGLPVKQSNSAHPRSQIARRPPPHSSSSYNVTSSGVSWDVFISHASEDKEAFVRYLAQALSESGLKVWYDEFTLTLGDSLRRSIDHGLSNSRFGIVVLSQSFFSKEWPQKELDGLVAKEITSGKLILPIWHNVSKEDVAKFSPILADRLAVSSDKGVEQVVQAILGAIKKKSQ